MRIVVQTLLLCVVLIQWMQKASSLSLPPNVNRISHGIQSLKAISDADPMCRDDVCGQPGFTSQAIFNLSSFSKQHVYDGKIGVPDGWSYQHVKLCNFETDANEISSWSDYSAVVHAETTDKKHGLFHHSTHTSWYQAITKLTARGQSVLVRKKAYCQSYQMTRQKFEHDFLTEDFKQRVKALPSQSSSSTACRQSKSCLSEQDQQVFLDFVNDFGDAVIQTAVFGGSSIHVNQFNHSSFSFLKSQQGDLSHSATLDMLCDLGDKVLCNPNDPHFDKSQYFTNASMYKMISYVPALVSDSTLGYGGKAWSEAVDEDPDVIKYTYEPIWNLLNHFNFPLDLQIEKKAALLKAFLANDYCQLVDGGCPETPPPQSSWSQIPKTSSPVARGGVTSVPSSLSNSSYVVFGGSNGTSGTFNTPMRYDISSNKWSYLPKVSSMSTSFDSIIYTSSSKFNEMLTICGGLNSVGQASSSRCIQFDEKLNKWHDLESLNQPRFGHCLVNLNQSLYVLGGFSDAAQSNSLSSLEFYSQETDSWQFLNPMPESRSFHACSVVDDRYIYVIGGKNSTGVASSVLVYDALYDDWMTSTPPSMQANDIPRFAHTQQIFNNSLIFVFGGAGSDNVPLQDVRVLNLTANEWLSGCPLATAVMHAGSARVNVGTADVISIFGGFTSSDTTAPTSNNQLFTIYSNSRILCDTATGVSEKSLEMTSTKPAYSLKSVQREYEASSKMLTSSISDSTPLLSGSSLIGSGLSTISGELTGPQIFDVSCPSCDNHVIDGETLPKFLSASKHRRCSYHSDSSTLSDEASLAMSASAFVNIKARAGIPILFDFSFTANAAFNAHVKAIQDYQHIMTTANAQCSHHEINLNQGTTNSTMPPFSGEFLTAVASSPSQFDPSNVEFYQTFVSHFGDTIVTSATHGSKASSKFLMTSSKFSATLTANIDINEKTRKSFLCFWGSSHSEDASASINADIGFSEYTLHNTTTCQPDCPPAVVNGTWNTTEWFNEINNISSSAPVTFTVIPLTDVLQPQYFDSNSNITASQLSSLRSGILYVMSSGTMCDSIDACQRISKKPIWSNAMYCPAIGCTQAANWHVVNSSLVSIGGALQGQDSFLHSRYSLKNELERWNYDIPAPIPYTTASSLFMNDSIFVVAPEVSGSVTASAFMLFNSTWLNLTSLPNAMKSMPILQQDTSVVAFWGNDTHCQAYNLDSPSSTWNSKNLHEEPCLSQAAVLQISGKNFIVGGIRSDGSCSDKIMEYDFGNDFFLDVGQLPNPSCHPHSHFVNISTSILIDDDGKMFLVDENLNFEFLISTPISPSPTSRTVFNQDDDELFLLDSNEVFFKLNPVLNTTFSPTLTASKQSAVKSPHKHADAQVTVTMNHQHEEIKSDYRRGLYGDKPTRKFPFLSSFLHGYSSIEGDPLSVASIDSGWRFEAIFDTPSNDSSIWVNEMDVPGDDYNWLLPQGLNGQGLVDSDSCKYFEFSKLIQDSWNYRTTMSQFHSLASGKFGWPSLFGYEYTASDLFNLVAHASANFKTEFLLAVGRCKRYQIQVESESSSLNFTAQFVEQLRQLPSNNQSTYDSTRHDFLKRYGTWIPNKIELGALVSRLSFLASAELDASISAGFDLSAAAKANLLFLFGAKAAAGADININMDADLKALMQDNATVCVPTCPPGGADIETTGQSWLNSLLTNSIDLEPVGVEFQTIADAIFNRQNQLPSDLQGNSLTSRLEGLVDFIESGRFCRLENCHQAQPQTNFIDSLTNEPTQLRTPVSYASSVTIGDSVLAVLGGETGANDATTATNTVQIYDQGEWTTRYFLQQARSRASATVDPTGLVWICGGSNSSVTSMSSCETSVKADETWSQGPVLNYGRSSFVLEEFDSKLFAIGGIFSNGSLTSTIEMLDLSLPSSSQKWTVLTLNLPEPTSFMASLSMSNGIVLVGGQTSSQTAIPNILIVNDSSVSELNIPMKLPVSLSQALLVPLTSNKSSAQIFGGIDGKGNVSKISMILDLMSSSITFGSTSTRSFKGSTVTAVNNDESFIIMGGLDSANTVIANCTFLQLE